jgi:hypothetical protein
MSGWKTATLELESDDLEEAVDTVAERHENVKLIEEDTIAMAGYDAGIRTRVDEIIEESEADTGRVLIINANDTSDSGSGKLFELTENGVEIVEEEHGYEGARGHDVTGYFREEYDINGRATFY